MSFLGSWEYRHNDGIDQHQTNLLDFYNQLNKKSKGEQHANEYLKMIMQGRAGDLPMMAALNSREAVAMREADRTTPDSAFAASPELYERTKNLNKARTEETFAGAREQMGSDVLGNLLNLSNSAYLGRQGLRGNILEDMAQNETANTQLTKNQGWGQMLMNAVIGGAEAAGGMGWQPFKHVASAAAGAAG